MQYDSLFKSLFQSSLSCLIQRLAGSPAVEQLNVEFPSVEKRVPDLVTRLANGRILHLELQTVNDDSMPLRMLRYWVLLADRFPQNHIEQMVLYAGYPELSMRTGIDRDSLNYHYHLVDFRDLEAADLVASPLPAERMLAILCHTPDMRKTIRAVLASWSGASQKERASLLQSLVIVSGLRKLRSVVKEEVGKMAFDIDELIAEHERASRAEWLQEGQHRGEATLFHRQLERKFGPLSSATEDRIKSATPSMIEEWGVRILDAKTLDEVFA